MKGVENGPIAWNFVAEFWSHVDTSIDGCWIWPTKRTQKTYVYVQLSGTKAYAHRVAWRLANGRIPDGALILHSCDNKHCVNPHHLRPGTSRDNHNDRVERGLVPRGTQHIFAKLTEEAVTKMRNSSLRNKRGMFVRWSIDYGVSTSTIGKAIRRDTWRHIP